MNVSKGITRNYDKMDTWSSGKNKPKTNPIQTQYKANSNPNKPNFTMVPGQDSVKNPKDMLK